MVLRLLLLFDHVYVLFINGEPKPFYDICHQVYGPVHTLLLQHIP